MKRFALVCVVCLVVAAADLTSHFAIAFGAGVIFGAGFFLMGASNGGMRPVGLAAPHLMPKDLPKKATDPNAGIGCALAVSGIASSVVTQIHYPLPFRILYAVFIVAGIVVALVHSWRSRTTVVEP